MAGNTTKKAPACMKLVLHLRETDEKEGKSKPDDFR